MPPLNDRPRVVHIVPAYFRKDGGIIGGAERYALELARAMARRGPTGRYSFGPATGPHRIDALDGGIFRTTCHVRSAKGNPISAAMLPRLLGFDVIHCHQNRMIYGTAAAALSRVSRRKVFGSDLGGAG